MDDGKVIWYLELWAEWMKSHDNKLGYKKKSEHIEEITSESYKELSKELDINWIIAECVLDGNYKQLQREIYRLKQTNKRLKSEIGIYKRAYDNINGKGNKHKSKSTKIQSQE